MAEISAALVKELRETSGAGMMDCKKALDESKGNMDAAVDWLRKKGLATAAKKSGRVASEGLVAVATSGSIGAVVELNAETDFVSRNEEFQAFVTKVAQLALQKGDVDALKATALDGGTVESKLTELIAKIGENMNLRRTTQLKVTDGVVASYVHGAIAPGRGKIGVLVAVESKGDKAKLEQLGKQIAMHIAAAKPEALDVSSVSAASLQRERDVLTEQAKASGKAPDMISKMVDGRIRKYYEQVVLLEQIYVIDGESKVSAVVEKAAKEIGAPVKISGYVSFVLGEGIEKKEDNFAAEVAAMAR